MLQKAVNLTDGYDCYQNALVEKINGIPARQTGRHRADKKMARESVEIYNTRRPHLSLKYKMPYEVHRAFSG
ncbi:transposase [Serratia rhizosphaerae]|uniref:Transposase n=1 Tax=Serratia rhizosphaerae TaxID=2597702 RepID=A0ABX6GUH8_9GAMM|nr:transposase [Serratia rhizosphaerae]